MADGQLDEKDSHINSWKLKAILFALQSFERKIRGKHIRVLCDNTTAINYVNEKGGTKSVACKNSCIEI